MPLFRLESGWTVANKKRAELWPTWPTKLEAKLWPLWPTKKTGILLKRGGGIDRKGWVRIFPRGPKLPKKATVRHFLGIWVL